jgi:hypothetical protein
VLVLTVGERPPAMSVSWVEPRSPLDSGFVVFFSDFDPDREDDRTPTLPVCLHCLVQDADAQLARGLDLARRDGQVDYDAEAGRWFVPADSGWARA